MGDHGVDAPLWSGGLLFSDRDELHQGLEVSAELADDLARWGGLWQTESGRPGLDAMATGLVARLTEETRGRWRFVYKR